MSAQPHKDTDIELFIAHLIRCPVVSRQASTDLPLTLFYDGAETPYKLIWGCALDFWRNNGVRIIPVEHLYAALQQRMSGLPEFSIAEARDSVLQAAYRVYCVPDTSLIENEGLKQLEDFILMRAAAPKLREALTTGPEGLRDFMSTMRRMGVSDTPKVSSESVKPFLKGEVRLGVEPRRPCGATFIDLMLQGGPRPKEVYGLLAISGGGKTTLSNQIAVESARVHRRAAVFTYEEPLSNEYFIPTYACASGLERSVFESLPPGSGLDSLAAENRIQVEKSMGEINDWIEFFDMSGTGGRGHKGVAEIDALLEQAKAKNKPIETVIVDWFWILVVRYFNRSANSKFEQERHFAQQMCDALKELAARQNVWILVNQQLAPDKGSSSKKKTWMDSAEVKSFAWYFNGCFVLEPLKEDITTLHLSKGRSVKTNSMPMRLDGARATFVPASGDFVYDKRLGKYVPKGQGNLVPQAEEPEPSLNEFGDQESGG